jgi:hypothetical protein
MRFIPSMTMFSLFIILSLIYHPFSHAQSKQIELFDIKRSTWTHNSDNYSKAAEHQGGFNISVGMGSTGDMGYGVAGLSLRVPSQLVLDVTTSGTLRTVDSNAFIGIVVDYHTPSGYIKRTGFPLGLFSKSREDFVPAWGKGTKPDNIIQPQRVDSTGLVLDLGSNAPIGWDGIIWLNSLIENTGVNTGFQLRIPSVKMHLDSNPIAVGNIDIQPPINWKQISLVGRTCVIGNLDGPETLALNKFISHTTLQIPIVPIQTLPSLPVKKSLLVIGRLEDLHKDMRDKTDLWSQLLKDEKPWREEQGYLIKYSSEEDLLVAVSIGHLGLVYAISQLQRCSVLTPEPSIALENYEMLEKPKTQERGVYINIGYGLSCGPITTDNWHEDDWEDFIDNVVLSRATLWSFFLWTEIETIYPDSNRTDLIGKNEFVFRMLKHAIDYSHKRGLRAVFLFTPTNIPADMVARHPEWACQLEYTNSGGICSNKPASYEMVKLIHRYQMDYFKEADEFDIAFYDPGGCMCEQCRQRDVQLEQLLKQIDDFSRFTRELNPTARFGFWTWAVWRYERIHQYSLQNLLLPEVAKRLQGKVNQIAVIDSFHGDTGSVPYFEEARKLGFRTSNFVYQTNIEDGNILLLPLFDFQKKWAAMTQDKQLDEAFLMIMEVKSKYPMAHFGCEFFWDATLKKELVAERYALQISGNLEATRMFRDGFLEMDNITYDGVIGTDNPIQTTTKMIECFDNGISKLPEIHQNQLKWLASTAKIYGILALSSNPRTEKDSATLEKYKAEYMSTLRNDPLFEYFANSRGEAFFDRMVGWITNGFKQGYF